MMVVLFLLKFDAIVDLADAHGRSAMHYAALNVSSWSVLITRGLQCRRVVNLADAHGRSEALRRAECKLVVCLDNKGSAVSTRC